MSEDDNDGEWVNVHHSSDEDQTEVVRILSLDLIVMMGDDTYDPILFLYVRLRNYRVSQRTSATLKLRRSAPVDSSRRTTSKRSVSLRWPKRSAMHPERDRRGRTWRLMKRRRGRMCLRHGVSLLQLFSNLYVRNLGLYV